MNIVFDLDNTLSRIASANGPPPSRLCHASVENCEQKIVPLVLYRLSMISSIFCFALSFAGIRSHSSSINRSTLSYFFRIFYNFLVHVRDLDQSAGRTYVHI